MALGVGVEAVDVIGQTEWRLQMAGPGTPGDEVLLTIQPPEEVSDLEVMPKPDGLPFGVINTIDDSRPNALDPLRLVYFSVSR